MKVRQIQVVQAKEGMVVAQDLYTNKNELIIPCDTKLSHEMIEKIKYYEIYRFSVYEEEVPAEKSVSTQQPVSHIEKVRSSQDFIVFKKDFDHTLQGLKKTFCKMLENEEGTDGTEILVQQVEHIMKNGKGSLHVMDMLNCMREYDDVTFAHSISVSLLCRLLGEWLSFSDSDIHILTLCGLLHDIGKLQIDNAIISKQGKLTDSEYKIIQGHPMLGYRLLEKRDLDNRVKYAALSHHERCDGKGYPLRISSDNITFWSKIVMVADVYDAMTADRSYRKGMCPFKALDIMLEDGFSKYDPKVLMTFMEKTVQAYINSYVELSNGEIGEIICSNSSAITRPLIRVGNTFVDLAKNKEINIDRIL